MRFRHITLSLGLLYALSLIGSGCMALLQIPPPPPDKRVIVIRPSRPDNNAQWVDGYWRWSVAKGRYHWVDGYWKIEKSVPGKKQKSRRARQSDIIIIE
jgi:hypothetical protein